MLSRCDLIKGAAVALLTFSIQGAWAQETKMNLFKIVTIKDEIIIGLSAEELQALGGNDASAVAHALAQKGDPGEGGVAEEIAGTGQQPQRPFRPLLCFRWIRLPVGHWRQALLCERLGVKFQLA